MPAAVNRPHDAAHAWHRLDKVFAISRYNRFDEKYRAMIPHSIKHLRALGVEAAIAAQAVRTLEAGFFNRFGLAHRAH